ncbi:hypothetical protein [Paraburkholderia sp. C35]|uniref:hypothetical protein n=1 Tax=Paraburkholderia sp. C35 TaxID=2126993 RepID=UPI000D690B97|nr:hypothetical protein [Paraburkholderia sp. C35]
MSQFARTNTDRILSYNPFRPDIRLMAEMLGIPLRTTPEHLADSIALSQMLYEVEKDATKSQHIELWDTDERKLRETHAFHERVSDLLSQRAYYLDCPWGELQLLDASFRECGHVHSQVALVCYPDAIIDDPKIADDLCVADEYMHNYALDVMLVEELGPLVYKYSGPCDIDVDEGDEYHEGMIIRICSEPGKPFPSAEVAAGIARMFERENFHACFQQVVEQVQAIHDELRGGV